MQYEAFAGTPRRLAPPTWSEPATTEGWSFSHVRSLPEAVGAASATPVADGVPEICGVAVPQPYRGRGIAAALTWRLTELARAAGANVPFVVPGGEDAARVYRRVGYQLAGQMLHLSRTK